jgi:hypothetical protein
MAALQWPVFHLLLHLWSKFPFFVASSFIGKRFYIDGPAEYGDFMALISELMSDTGVLVAQMGEAPSLGSPPTEVSEAQNRFKFIQRLPQFGFQSIVDYEEVGTAFVWVIGGWTMG